MSRLQHLSVETVGDHSLLVHRALDVPALVVVVVERLEIDVMRLRIGANEASQLTERNAGPGLDRRPPFDTVMIHAIGNLRKLPQILYREPHRIADEPTHFERPFPPHALIPDRHCPRDEIARQLVAGVVGTWLDQVHRRVAQKLPFYDEILPLGVFEQLVRRLGTPGVAGSEKGRRHETASPNEKVAAVDSVDRDVFTRIDVHVASGGGGAAGARARLGKRL